MTELSIDMYELLNFAYHLRVRDTHDTYTLEFLNGLVHPHELVIIICSNKWNVQKKCMENVKLFKIQNDEGVLCYEKNTGRLHF